MNEKKLRKRLYLLSKSEPNTIRARVASEALNNDSVKQFFNDLNRFGCISVMVSCLIYFKQTHEFFDTFYDDIEKLRLEFEEERGTGMRMPYDLKNTLAWFAFEQTADALALELGIY